MLVRLDLEPAMRMMSRQEISDESTVNSGAVRDITDEMLVSRAPTRAKFARSIRLLGWQLVGQNGDEMRLSMRDQD